MKQTPKIIAVAGGSGSGKTTLVNRLRETAGVMGPDALLVIQLDHYYRDLSHLTPAERDRRNFDHPDAFDTALLREQLAALVAGKAVDRPSYDFATHTRTAQTTRIAPAPIILLDGILSLHEAESRKLFDLKVFVDVSDDVRFIRRLRRDIKERGRTMDGVVTQYLATVREMHNLYVAPQRHVADIIVSWEDYNDRAVAMLAGMVRSWLQ